MLRFRVWLFFAAINFVSRGLEFLEQFKINSFIVNPDDDKKMYATLSHETKQKNWRGGIDKTDAPKRKTNVCGSKFWEIVSCQNTVRFHHKNRPKRIKSLQPLYKASYVFPKWWTYLVRVLNINSSPVLCTISRKMLNALLHTQLTD